MKREDIQTVKNLEACILQAEKNIQGYEGLMKEKEIKISSNDKDSVLQPKYVTGKAKDAIIALLIEEQKIYLDRQLAALEKM